jgi:hypothetical protein
MERSAMTWIPRAIIPAGLTVLSFLSAGALPARAQTISDKICTAAQAHLARTGELVAPTFLAAASLNSRAWQAISAPVTGASVGAASGVNVLYVAYVRPKAFEDAGAVAVRIAVPAGEYGKPTNEVEVYRPAIARGTNRCEPVGRYEIDTTVRLNQYIDYHADGGGRANSTLEDFHFSYPVYPRNCVKTDRGSLRRTFAFGSEVTRTQGDTLAQRYLRFIGPAYGVTHKFARLRSELHYRPAAQLTAACIGFTVPLNRDPATVTIGDYGFGSIWWTDRTLNIQR